MTVGSETSTAEFAWTGVEASFPTLISAETVEDIVAFYVPDGADTESPLVRTVNVNVQLAPETNYVTLTPATMPAAPGTVVVRRVTPALQETEFANLQGFSSRIYETLHDRAFRAIAELRRDLARIGGPWTIIGDLVNFAGYRLRGKAPVEGDDFATKAYVDDTVGAVASGDFVTAAEAAAADAAESEQGAQSAQASAALSEVAAAGYAAAAAGHASALANPHFGFYTGSPIGARDYGSYV